MDERLFAGVALVAALAVGITTFRKKSRGLSKNQKFIEKAKKAGHFTTGEYVDSKVILGTYGHESARVRGDSLKVQYKYMVDGVVYHKTMTFQSVGRVGTQFPASVTVYYDPQNPQKAICPEEATDNQKNKSGCLTAMGVTILTLAAVFYILKILIG